MLQCFLPASKDVFTYTGLLEVKRTKMPTFGKEKQLAACAGRCNHYALLGPPDKKGETKM